MDKIIPEPGSGKLDPDSSSSSFRISGKLDPDSSSSFRITNL